MKRLFFGFSVAAFSAGLFAPEIALAARVAVDKVLAVNVAILIDAGGLLASCF